MPCRRYSLSAVQTPNSERSGGELAARGATPRALPPCIVQRPLREYRRAAGANRKRANPCRCHSGAAAQASRGGAARALASTGKAQTRAGGARAGRRRAPNLHSLSAPARAGASRGLTPCRLVHSAPLTPPTATEIVPTYGTVHGSIRVRPQSEKPPASYVATLAPAPGAIATIKTSNSLIFPQRHMA
jgi:hypothetical protein